jgi:hypothetical protein
VIYIQNSCCEIVMKVKMNQFTFWNTAFLCKWLVNDEEIVLVYYRDSRNTFVTDNTKMVGSKGEKNLLRSIIIRVTKFKISLKKVPTFFHLFIRVEGRFSIFQIEVQSTLKR